MGVSDTTLDRAALLSAWPLGEVRRMTPTEPGHNNRSWIVEADAGKYVLRRYDNLGERAIRFEHALLTYLGRTALPFAVPVPVESSARSSLHVAYDSDGRPIRLALFPFLPGEHPPGEDLEVAERLGEALAHLHPALASATDALGPSPNTGYGDLHNVHPLLPDPLAAGHALDLDAAEGRALERTTQRALEAVARWYPRLPRQLIHSDYGFFNILMEDGRVSAVLDFEFSCRDVRAMDFASGVRNASRAAWFHGGSFEPAARFMRGYARVQRPTDDEVRAIPELVRLADVVIMLHWTGRMLQGLAEREPVLGSVRRVLAASEVVDTRGPELVETLRRVIAS